MPFGFSKHLAYCSSLLCLMLAGAEPAQPTDTQTEPPATYREAIQRVGAMDVEGLPAGLARILEDYYKHSFGGEDNWATVESMRFDGTLRLPEGAVRFRALKKKPDYCQIILFGGSDARVIMSYDGSETWQIVTAAEEGPSEMPPLEALNFIRDASFGSHLLHPKLPGKTVELLGIRKVGKQPCHDLRVTLANGQQITYAIHVVLHEEKQQIVKNAVTGDTEVITHFDSRIVHGVQIPYRSEMSINGEFVHEVKMQRVELNLGIMPWTFSRPTGAYVADGLGAPATNDTEVLPGTNAPAPTWGVSFGESHFPDLAPAEPSILKGVGVSED